jgi:hypothetical protein
MDVESSEDAPFLEHNQFADKPSRKGLTNSFSSWIPSRATLALGLILVFSNIFWLLLYTTKQDVCVRPQLIYCKSGHPAR